MKYLLVSVFFLSAAVAGFSQKEPTARVTNRNQDTLTKAQQEWLSINFKALARTPKDRAAALLKQNFPSVSQASLEASLEFLIGQASELIKSEQGAQRTLEQLRQEQRKQHPKIVQQQQQQQQEYKKRLEKQQQQTQLQQLLERLKAQKATILAEIAKKEAELAATADIVLRELMKLVINGLKQTLATLNNGIKEAEEALRTLQNQ
jgi:hypothetical protein